MGKLRQLVVAPKLEALFTAALVLFGFHLGARPIGDNSMFTHLRTGVDMATTGSIPRTDPYSVTAAGDRWTVQSWLPEWTYGWAHRLGGYRLVVLEQALLIAFLAWLVVRLARAGSPLRSALAGLVAVGIGAALWTPRPLLFGLICMALMITVVERRSSPWLLLPIVWLWVNSHGSFPLGLAWLGARALGEGLDWHSWPREASRYIGAFLAGLVVSIANPLGARLLFFPLTLGAKQAAFKSIVEWRSPDFSRAGGHTVLFFLALAFVLLLRAKLGWRDVLPVVGFVVAALLAARNIGPLAVVVAPSLGRALRRSESTGPGVARSVGANERLNRVVLATLCAAFLLLGTTIFTNNGLDVVGYPVGAVTYLESQGLLAEPHHLAHQDFVGNYLTLRYGDRARVFVDDRFDMYPLSVSADYSTLLGGRAGALEVLDRRHIDVVLWKRALPLAVLLDAKGWRETFSEGEYVVLQR